MKLVIYHLCLRHSLKLCLEFWVVLDQVGKTIPPELLAHVTIHLHYVIDLLIAKCCNDLKSDDKKTRKKAIERLSKFLYENYSRLDKTERVDQIFKSILRCFSDKTENCREEAVNVVIHVINTYEEEEQYLMYLMPVLLQRLGGQDIAEPSEEVRLSLVSLMHSVIKKFTSDSLPPYLNDMIQILVKTLVDPHPKIKKESCECASDLAKTIPKHFHMQSEPLIMPLLQNFTHQHYRVRIAAIIGIVMTPLAERLFDQTPMVRQAVISVIGMWLVELPDRYSFFHRLLPLILTGLTDETSEIQKEAAEKWDAAGKQYIAENENDLKDELDFLTDIPQHYPILETRPNLGCRTLVKRNLIKIIPAIVNELGDWLADVRTKASQLLYSVILNAEIQITHHLEKVLIGMYKASRDEDLRVVYNIERAAELLGYFVPPNTYCELVLPTMEESIHEGQLRVFSNILKGSESNSLKAKLTEIGDFLCRPEVCQSKERGYQLHLLNCCEALISVSETDCREIGYQLFIVALSVLGLAADEIVNKRALDCMHELQLMEGRCSVQDLFKKYVQQVLEQYKCSADSWAIYSAERFIFEAILTYSGPTVGLHLSTITPILLACLKPDKDPEVKLKMFTILSTLVLGKEHVLKNAPNLGPFLVTLVKDIIIPNLVWQAGRTPEAIRTAGISCLYVAFQQHSGDFVSPFSDKEVLSSVLEPLLPLLLTLIEDSSRKTRLITCQTISRMIILTRCADLYTHDLVNRIYPVVLKRLDDTGDDVRLAAIATLVKMFKSLPGDYNREVSRAHIEALYSTVLIHLDDPDPAFQHFVLDALKQMAVADPRALYDKINNSINRFRNVTCCRELMDFTLELIRQREAINIV
ncbi:Dynein assembly factor 5 [Blattella germanica]|nr:Dynein assembly factor 5 [Blattella germanica]